MYFTNRGWENDVLDDVMDMFNIKFKSPYDVLKEINKVSKELEGEYILTIKDNAITLVDSKGNKYVAKCHPEDNFSISEGIKEAFKKKEQDNAIKIGDTVEVINNSESFTKLDRFFDRHNLERYASKYRYGTYPCNKAIGKVVGIVKVDKVAIVVIETVNGNYVINEKGLKRVVLNGCS